MIGLRVLAICLLTYAGLWVAAYRGLWYDAHVFARKSPTFEFQVGDFSVEGGKARVLVFFVWPIILAAVCGALWEAALMARSQLWSQRGRGAGTRMSGNSMSTTSRVVGVTQGNKPAPLYRVWRYLRLSVRPLGEGSAWVSVGEALALLAYVLIMTTMVWQGTNFKVQAHLDSTMPCPADPSSRCEKGTDHVASTSIVVLKNVAKYMGFVAAVNLSLVLVPVSRDSKIWSILGVPSERAVLYHAALGHLTFLSVFLHGALYMAYYVQKHGWGYAANSAFYYKGHGVNVPAGFVAALCALPMWLLSLPFVRREHYNSLFKTSHFLFVGVLGGGMVHYDGFVYYLLAGLALYLMHAVSRLGNWNWWSVLKQCFCKSGAAAARGCGSTSLVHLHAGDEYTRLVLRSPCSSAHRTPRGDMFVYVSAPALLGTIEAHPMSVALRGPPPHLWNTSAAASGNEGIFTLYVKTMGSWTRALQKQEGDNLVVHVDGLYGGSPLSSLASMKAAGGFQRVLLFAGGSGVTSFTALIQDWCEALANGDDLPDIHLIWSCRRIEEMELLGEALPSFLAAAPPGAEARCKISLFCSGKVAADGEEPLSVSWPVAKAAATENAGAAHGLGVGIKTPQAVFDSLNSGVRTLIAGGGALAGWLWAENMAKGARAIFKRMAVFFMMAAVPATLLFLYGWATRVGVGLWLAKKRLRAPSRKRYIQLREMGGNQDEDQGDPDPEGALGVVSDTAPTARKTCSVHSGRAPVEEILFAEHEIALREGFDRVKVLVSGPSGMVDTVMAQARKVSWRLFDVQSASREF